MLNSNAISVDLTLKIVLNFSLQPPSTSSKEFGKKMPCFVRGSHWIVFFGRIGDIGPLLMVMSLTPSLKL